MSLPGFLFGAAQVDFEKEIQELTAESADVVEEQIWRSSVTRKHQRVLWRCGGCGKQIPTSNKIKRLRCDCGTYMEWSY
jgi:hypothetical protein